MSSQDRPRVLIVTQVFPRHPGDAAAPFMLRYAQGLAAAGVQVEVAAPHDAGLPPVHDVGGITVRRLRYGSDAQERLAYRGEMHRLARTPAGAWRALRLLVALWRHVRAEDRSGRFDVIDVHWLVPSAIAVAFARLRTPARVHVHGTDLAVAAGLAPLRLLCRWALGRFDQIVAVSGPLDGELRATMGRGADVVAPMPMAVPATPPTPPPGERHVLAVGRLVPEKGHADLIAAVAALRAELDDVTVTIVGDGPERDHLAAAAAASDVPLTLTGSLAPEELSARYLGADVVCVPSHREGFGLVAAEALAHDRPVVATGAGGLAEIVHERADAATGWRVPAHDPAALADALRTALTDRDEAARRAAAGRRYVVERWSPGALGRAAREQLAQLARR